MLDRKGDEFKMTKEYVCPHCKAENITVVEKSNELVLHEIAIETGEVVSEDREEAEHIGWECPKCGAGLDIDRGGRITGTV
jgi:hypothetical protein